MDCPRCGTPMEGCVCPECGFPVIRIVMEEQKSEDGLIRILKSIRYTFPKILTKRWKKLKRPSEISRRKMLKNSRII